MSHPPQPTRSRPARILVGDIGATHSRLAIYGLDAGRIELSRQETYASSDHACLTDVLVRFLQGEREDVEAACLGLPAPIHAGVVFPLTNLPWTVDRADVLAAVGTDRVALINDVEASAAGIAGLSPDDLTCLQVGHADPLGNRVVVSIGTGLGVSALTPSGQTFATEAGHASFAPQREPDFELLAALQREHGHVSWERVASGPALPAIHGFLTADRSPRLDGPEIVRRSEVDPDCRRAVGLFRRYVGAAAGNIALTLMATGGLYLGGGAATKVFGIENAETFVDAFRDKGRMRGLLENVPVFVVDETNLALRGAAQRAIALFESGE